MDISTLEKAAGGLLLVVAASTFVLSRRKNDVEEIITPIAKKQNIAPSIELRPSNQLRIVHAPDELISHLGCTALETQIRENLGLTPTQYNFHVQPILHQFALFVQCLPASESHHHANKGGLLIHLFECAAHASKLTGAYKLPKGLPTETQMRYAAHWSVGITICALLHDVGKPVSNLKVDLFGENPQIPIARWSGLSGPMSNAPGATHYTVEFIYSDYKAHTRLPVLLLQSLVPETTRRWLEEEPSLMPAMMSYLSGEANQDDSIAKIVTEADRFSTAENLKHGPKTRFASARSVPFIERMLFAMRQMLAEGGLALNRGGAAGFIDPDGKTAWFVVGTLIDKTREWLDSNETRHEGAANLPKDNSRWLDTLQEYGAIINNGNQAVWHISINIAQEGGKPWTQRLSVIRFEIDLLYKPGSGRPAPLIGTIEVVESSKEPKHTETPNQAAQSEPRSNTAEAFPSSRVIDDVVEDNTEPSVDSAANDAMSSLAMLTGLATGQQFEVPSNTNSTTSSVVEPETQQVREGDYLTESDSAGSVIAEIAQARTPAVLQEKPVQPSDEHTGVGSITGLDPLVEHFISWLKHSVSMGTMTINEKTSLLHIVPEGMGMVSPAIYTNFVNERVDLFPNMETLSGNKREVPPHKAVQKAVEGSGLLLLNDQKSRLHKFSAKTGGNAITLAVMHRPQRFIMPLPPENKALTRTGPPIRIPNQ